MNNLKDTNIIIKINDIAYNQIPNLNNDIVYKDDYMCLRDLDTVYIYIKEEDFKKLINIESIYDKNNKTINLSELLKYQIDIDCKAIVANNVVPKSVIIKQILTCKIEGINNIFIIRKVEVNESSELFKDLVNIQTLKEKHRLD
jgi:hypothetical protein